MFAKLDKHTEIKFRINLEFIKRPIYEFLVQKLKVRQNGYENFISPFVLINGHSKRSFIYFNLY